MSTRLRKISEKYSSMNLSAKISISYLFIFLIIFILTTYLFEHINNDYSHRMAQKMSWEISESIGKNFDTILDTVNNQSKMLISNSMLRETLSNKISAYDKQIVVSNYLTEFINFDSLVSSIYIFDLVGNKYNIENDAPKNISLVYLKQQPWFKTLTDLNGGYLIRSDVAVSSDSGNNYISFMRVINDLDSQKPIGYLIINISVENIKSLPSYKNSKYDTSFIVKDASNEILIYPENSAFLNLTQENTSDIVTIAQKDYLVSNITSKYGLDITSITPTNELEKQSQTYGLTVFIVLIIGGLLFVFGMLFISLIVTKPIHKLVVAMSSVEKGEFREAKFVTNNDEIGKLKNVYNLMISEIQRLFRNIVIENRAKRKKELEILQAQIKPHFLYNSFDAISALALAQDNRDVYNLVKALSKFYKGFLNYGKEKISVRQELEIIEQYLTIQKTRFEDKIIIQKKYDEKALDYQIPRLILQPLVENAFNHGIKGLKSGTITLEAYKADNSLYFIIADNGAGMDAGTLQAIKDGQSQGVGLKTSIERLRIYYTNPDVFSIESQENAGTTIKIRIPLPQEELADNVK